MEEPDKRVAYPYFFSPEQGRYSDLIEFESRILGREHRLRIYVPPGYDENTLAHYPVVFMQDGQNLFFPQEAFMGHEWQVDETSRTLAAMCAVEDAVFIGIYSEDRMRDYTRPGYEPYGRSLAEEIVQKRTVGCAWSRTAAIASVWGSLASSSINALARRSAMRQERA